MINYTIIRSDARYYSGQSDTLEQMKKHVLRLCGQYGITPDSPIFFAGDETHFAARHDQGYGASVVSTATPLTQLRIRDLEDVGSNVVGRIDDRALEATNLVMRDFTNKAEEGWIVLFQGRFTTPVFNSKGAGDAYLTALQNGTRKPEYPYPEEGA